MVPKEIKTTIFQTIDALDDQLRDISLKVCSKKPQCHPVDSSFWLLLFLW